MAELYSKIEFKYAGTYKSDIKGKGFSPFNDIHSQMHKNRDTPPDEQEQKLSISWNKINKIGPGLENAGNTCFLNSVLQSLTYCPPFANFLLDKHHSRICRKHSEKEKFVPFCVLCAFEEHVNRCFPSSSKSILPAKIIKNLRSVAPRFRLGRQEDSHEFLRMLIDGMQKSSLFFKNKPDLRVQESTPIHQIFGGKLKSQVKCLTCNYCSEIFETIYDLSLDMKGCDSLEKSIEAFFRIEELHGENKYRCSKCKILVNAHKRFLLWKSPKVLTIHLKRFSNTLNKINKFMSFPPSLNLGKYLTQDNTQRNVYDLFAVLVHSGSQIWSGHYYCYVKNSNNIWYQMNDESVSTIDFRRVLDDRAYILFYVMREEKTKEAETKANIRKNSKDIIISPQEGIQNAKTANTNDREKVHSNVEKKNEEALSSQSAKEILEKSKNHQDYMREFSELFKKNKQTSSNVNEENKPNHDGNRSQNTNFPQAVKDDKILPSAILITNDQVERKEATVFDLLSRAQKIEPVFEDKNLNQAKFHLRPLKNSKRKKLWYLKWITDLKRVKVDLPKEINDTMEIEVSQQFNGVEKEKSRKNSIEILKPKNNVKNSITLEEYLKKEEPLEWDHDGSEQPSTFKKQREMLKEENKDFFEYRKREKDEYDKEYDKGKVKKVKKKKEKKLIDFERLESELKQGKMSEFRGKNFRGFNKFKKNKNTSKFKKGSYDDLE